MVGLLRHLCAHFGFCFVPHAEGSAAYSQAADSAALEQHAAASADERERLLDLQSVLTAASIQNRFVLGVMDSEIPHERARRDTFLSY